MKLTNSSENGAIQPVRIHVQRYGVNSQHSNDSTHFYPNVTTLRSGLCCRNSVWRLSVCLSVTLVHPTQRVEAFGNISSPLCTLAILWPPRKIFCGDRSRGTQEGYQNRAMLDLSKAISHKRYKISVYFLLKTNRKSYARYWMVTLPISLGDPWPRQTTPFSTFCNTFDISVT